MRLYVCVREECVCGRHDVSECLLGRDTSKSQFRAPDCDRDCVPRALQLACAVLCAHRHVAVVQDLRRAGRQARAAHTAG